MTFCKADVERLLAVIKLCKKILNYSVWGISTGKMTQTDALLSSVLENTVFHITFISGKC